MLVKKYKIKAKATDVVRNTKLKYYNNTIEKVITVNISARTICNYNGSNTRLNVPFTAPFDGYFVFAFQSVCIYSLQDGDVGVSMYEPGLSDIDYTARTTSRNRWFWYDYADGTFWKMVYTKVYKGDIVTLFSDGYKNSVERVIREHGIVPDGIPYFTTKLPPNFKQYPNFSNGWGAIYNTDRNYNSRVYSHDYSTSITKQWILDIASKY